MSYPTYAEMKDSGVEWLGKVPQHWRMNRLRFVCQINPSKSELEEESNDITVSFLPMEKVGTEGELVLDEHRTLADVLQGFTYFRDGDVIVAKITPCFENGKGAACRGLTNGIGFGSTEFHVLRPYESNSSRYIFYLTRSLPFRSIGTGSMLGSAGQKRVPEDFVKNFALAFPPSDEQHAIATFLDRKTVEIDALIRLKERQIELLGKKRQALISYAVTRGLDPAAPMRPSGIAWLGDIPEHWEVTQLRRCISKFVDYRGKTPNKTDSGIPLITAGAIKDGKIQHDKAPDYIAPDDYDDWMIRGFPERGDVVLTTEAPLGEAAQIVDEGIALAQRVILFRVNTAKITNGFLMCHWASEFGKYELWSNATGSTASGIKSDRLKATRILLPPISEQQAITAFIERETAQTSYFVQAIQKQINKLRDYRQALISTAVTGKIDVRGEGA